MDLEDPEILVARRHPAPKGLPCQRPARWLRSRPSLRRGWRCLSSRLGPFEFGKPQRGTSRYLLDYSEETQKELLDTLTLGHWHRILGHAQVPAWLCGLHTGRMALA